jgi:hypothetical protein
MVPDGEIGLTHDVSMPFAISMELGDVGVVGEVGEVGEVGKANGFELRFQGLNDVDT